MLVRYYYYYFCTAVGCKIMLNYSRQLSVFLRRTFYNSWVKGPGSDQKLQVLVACPVDSNRIESATYVPDTQLLERGAVCPNRDEGVVRCLACAVEPQDGKARSARAQLSKRKGSKKTVEISESVGRHFRFES